MGQILLSVLLLCCRLWLVNISTPSTSVVGPEVPVTPELAHAAPGHSPRAPGLVPVATASELGIPYDRYQVKDAFDRTVTFYVSVPGAGKPKDAPKAEASEDRPMPLALMVQGSGCASVFMKAPDGRIGGGLPNALIRSAKGRCRVVCVEKPGVNFLDNPQPPGSGEPCTEEFKNEHAFNRWVGACEAAVAAASSLPGVDGSRILAAGHSEGGIIAAGVAARNPRVTHVGVLANGGPTQLYDMTQFVRQPRSANDTPEECEKRVEQVYEAWERIKADPDSTSKTEWGHPYKRWFTFLSTSTLDQLLKTDARVFLAYGTADTSVPVTSCDALRAELARHGKDVTCERVIGGDHGYRVESKPEFDGISFVFDALVTWFLG